MYFSIVKANYKKDFIIDCYFENGKSGVIDFSSYIKDGEIFEALKDIETFKSFNVEYGTLTWKKGTIDIAAEKIYELATNEEIIFSGDEFKRSA